MPRKKKVIPGSLEAQRRIAIEKGATIEDMVKNHPGWKLLMEMWENLISIQYRRLAGQKPDEGYVKLIGFLERASAIRVMPKIVKNAEMVEYLMTQGRIAADITLQKAPQYFFDARIQAQGAGATLMDNVDQAIKEQKEFHQRQLR